MKREYRAFQIDEIRREPGKAPTITGYAAVFNKLSENLGGFRERIQPGAFAESLKQDDIRALVDHDPVLILGRNKAGTLTLAEDEQGLRVSIQVPNTNTGRDLIESMQRGDIDQMSFGFRTLDDEWHKESGETIRELKKAKLVDVSVVTFPAYPQTSAQVATRALWPDGMPDAMTEAIRNLADPPGTPRRDQRRERLEKIRK